MILVFGKTGQVALELQRQANVLALDRDQADLSDPAACARIILESDASVVINAAAYTEVDKAESEEALATVVNGEAPGAMAWACAERDIPFLHVSTDYVFAGNGERPWYETDPAAPQNAYGRSKLWNGGLAVPGTRQSCERHGCSHRMEEIFLRQCFIYLRPEMC